ncbi:MAG TPA: HD domain-containing phosphohydrolase [Clostridia bacterium]|nr:HD domain-containing phosphohydrolase [Clostridia bacterium]
MRLVNMKHMSDHYKLALNLYNTQGQILLKAGTQLSEKTIKHIRNLGYQSIYITDPISTEIMDDYMDPTLRFESLNKIEEAFKAYNYYVKLKEDNTHSGKVENAEYLYLNKIKDLADDLILYLSDKHQIQIQFMDLKRRDDYLLKHSLNVAIYSILLGFKMNLPKDKIQILGIGALLSDIGMNNVNGRITLKKDKLSKKDKSEVMKHPVWGYKFLKENHLISPMTRAVVLQHHERLDGSGYPRGLEGDKILDLAQIVAIADTFDALTSDRPYRKALLPKYALDYITSKTGVIATTDIIKKFTEIIVPYPNGTIIKLNDDRFAIVDQQNKGYPLRPKIDLITLVNGKIQKRPIDLLKENNLTIDNIEYEIENVIKL